MIFKVRYRRLGGHVHARVFSAGAPRATFALLGELTMNDQDWASFREQIRGWILVDETEPNAHDGSTQGR